MSTNGSFHCEISKSVFFGTSLLTALAFSFALPTLALPMSTMPHELPHVPKVPQELRGERPSEPNVPEGVETERGVPEPHDENEETHHHPHQHVSHEGAAGESSSPVETFLIVLLTVGVLGLVSWRDWRRAKPEA